MARYRATLALLLASSWGMTAAFFRPPPSSHRSRSLLMMVTPDLQTLQRIQEVAVRASREGGRLIKEKAGARVKDTK